MLPDLEKYRSLEQYAIDEGAYKAKLIQAGDVVIDDRVRLKCQVPVCKDYNNHLMCPPYTMPVEQFRSLCSQYPAALIIQAASQGFAENSLLEAEKRLHLIINKVEGRALTEGHYLACGFIASSCKLCPKCLGYHSKQPCRRPYEARPSIESMGVDIYKTSLNAGIGFSLGLSAEVIFSGLILMG